MHCTLPGSSVHGIELTCSALAGGFFTTEPPGKPLYNPWWLSGKESTGNAGVTGDVGSIPGLGRSPGGGNAAHSSILAWEITLAGDSPWGSKKVGHNLATKQQYNHYLIVNFQVQKTIWLWGRFPCLNVLWRCGHNHSLLDPQQILTKAAATLAGGGSHTEGPKQTNARPWA